MARKTETIVTLTDDIDGSTKDIQTVAFAIDGQSYEIDLGPKNAKLIREQFEDWAQHARKARKATGGRRSSSVVKPSGEAAAIRAWAQENGIEVPARGRIPAAIAEQYHSA